jgi:type II secretory ATPase GspE/PulE/Tfp pilus assembly ATPase PilB-like protein
MVVNNSYLTIAKANTSDDVIEKKDFFSMTWKKVFTEAHENKASDIHVQQFEHFIRVKLRILGDLCISQEVTETEEVRTTLINRLKAICHFELNVNDEAQDRSFSLKATNSRYRGVVTPGIFGENFVFRIIREEELPTIKNCLLPLQIEKDLLYAINRKQGFICITGPTGSGKSTTLQATLMEIARVKKNVITIEDPVERIIPDTVQQQISHKLTWAKAIKAAMRQDPDVILIGEIRDRESASLALEAAQTGHLVLSTLHTNDVSGIVDRLIGLGVDRKLIADNLLFISAQRLVQKLCPSCRTSNEHGGYDLGPGCAQCEGSKVKGIIGRQPIVEYSLQPDPKSILDFNKQDFKKNQLKTSLYSEALRLSQDGIISTDEANQWEEKGIWEQKPNLHRNQEAGQLNIQ